jgi:ABC-type glycerol-3-phosphate transport system permease component
MMTKRRVTTDLAERLLAGPVVWIGLTLLTTFALGPFLWMLLTSLKDRQELYATPLQYFPVHPTFQNYVDAWTSPVTPFPGSFSTACGCVRSRWSQPRSCRYWPVMPSRAFGLPGEMRCC